MIDREEAVRSDEAIDVQTTSLEVSACEWNRVNVAARLCGYLTENQIVSRKIGNYKSGTTFSGLQICLRERQNDDFAD
jgi:hypothetical protein